MRRIVRRMVVALTGLLVLLASRAPAPRATTVRLAGGRIATTPGATSRPVTRTAAPSPQKAPAARPRLPTAALPYIYGLHMVTPTIGWLNAGALFRSANGARTWTQVFQRPGAVLAWAAPTVQSAWVVMQSGPADEVQVWSTTDAGLQWHAVTLVAPWTIVGVRLHVTPSGDGAVLASGLWGLQTGPQRLWRIENNEVVATPAYTTSTGQLLEASWTSRTDGWATASSAQANDTAAVLFQTMDGGDQWTPVPLPLPASVPVPTGVSHFMPFLSLGHAPTFLGHNDGYVAAQLSLSTPTTPPTTYPVLYHSTNDRTWTPVWMGPPHHLLSYFQWVTPQVAWAILSPADNSTTTRVAVSTTSGRSWSVSMAPAQSANAYDLVAVSSTEAVLYVLLPTQVLKVYATTNGGQTWRAIR